MSEYPEHDKLLLVKDETQLCGEFMEWMILQGYTICRWDEQERLFQPVRMTIQSLLAKCYNIDIDALEKEKTRMLAEMRTENIARD